MMWLAATRVRVTRFASGSISFTAAMPASIVLRVPPVSCMTKRAQPRTGFEPLLFHEPADLVALAAEAHDQRAGEIGVARVARHRPAQKVHRLAGHLHAAAGAVREGDDAVDVRDSRPAARA